MSKHLRALGKLKKNVLGLTTINLDTEITSLSERRDKLPTLIFDTTDESTAAEVLANMVDKYHLKEASLIKREEKDRSGRITTTLGFPSSIEVTTFVDAINVELSAKCETQTVIDSAKRKVIDFFAVKRGGFREPIDGPIDFGGGIDGTTTSSILNYQRFSENANEYVDNSTILHFTNLVEKGSLKLEFEQTNPHFNTLSYIYTLTNSIGLKEKLDTSKEVEGAIRNEKGNIVIVKSDKNNVYNVFTNVSASGTPATTTTYDLNKESFTKIEIVNEKGDKETYSLTFGKSGLVVKENKMPTERTLLQVEKLVLDYRDTYIKNYTEYLPDFAQLKYFLNEKLEDGFGKYEPRVMESPKGEMEKFVGKISDSEKLLSKFTNLTVSIIEQLMEYNNLSKSNKINQIETYRKSISIAVLNLGTQNDNSKNILKTYGEGNLIVVKNALISLNKENDEIDTKITTLQTEKTSITNVQTEREEQIEDLEEILGGVDTTFIDKIGLSKDSIISASSAHTETLKIYSGARIDKIIKEAIAEGKFEVEVFELTDIEAKLLLTGGYYIKETTEPRKSGSNIIEVTSWTINWESANSTPTKIGSPIDGPIAGPIGVVQP